MRDSIGRLLPDASSQRLLGSRYYLDMQGEAIDISGRFRAQADVPGADTRWWGSTVRGALGTALKNLLCTVSHRRCDRCRRRSECAFPQLWEPRRTGGNGPLLQLPPWLVRVAWRDGRLGVVVRLFGPACAEEARLRIALEAALARGLTRARVAFLPDAPLQCTPVAPWNPPASAVGQPLVVQLATPLRLISDGKPRSQAPDFHSLLASTSRRWKLASLSWGWPPPPSQPPNLRVSIAYCDLAWRDFTRRSARQRTTLTLGGLVGTIVYEGEWRAALPFLQVASVIGLGKLTTHGFGQLVFGVQHGLGGTGAKSGDPTPE